MHYHLRATYTNMAHIAALNCPILHQPMNDPVKAPDGRTYERSAITRWVREHGNSPFDRSLRITVSDLQTDYTVKAIIDELNKSQVSNMSEEHKEPTATVTMRKEGVWTQIQLSIPDGESSGRNVAFVVDVSGSMGNEVSDGHTEADGFSILDVVRHAGKTCLRSLRDNDKACIISYSTHANLVLPMTQMDQVGRARAEVAMASLSSDAQTNIWAGLRMAIDQLAGSGDIFLLTDGQPNIRPTRGELHELKKITDTNDNITVHTFGFGCNLDSVMLFDMARVTHGWYGFIPNIGLVGTVFINAMANMLTTTHKKYVLRLETNEPLDLPGLIKTDWGYQYPIGPLTFGQPRDIFIKSQNPVQVSLDGIHIEMSNESIDNLDRHLTALGIQQCFNYALTSKGRASTALDNIVQTVRHPKLLEDLMGQVREALEPEAFSRWGKHYLPSLFLAHWLQRRNNFLDKGVQSYGGPTFNQLADSFDEDFNKLPAPKPTHRERVVQRCRLRHQQVTAAPTSMVSYNDRDGSCFAGTSKVDMSDGTQTFVEHVMAGDVVKTPKGPAKVRCVVKTWCEDFCMELVGIGNLLATKWHPIRHKGQWTFPVTIKPAEVRPCEAVYSFLLEPGFESMFIEGIECITLAHGVSNDKVATHAFFGTDKVIDCMKTLRGWDEGRIELQGGMCIQRDTSTNLVSGFLQTFA